MQHSISPGLLSNRWIYKRLVCKSTDANPSQKHRQESVVPLETIFLNPLTWGIASTRNKLHYKKEGLRQSILTGISL